MKTNYKKLEKSLESWYATYVNTLREIGWTGAIDEYAWINDYDNGIDPVEAAKSFYDDSSTSRYEQPEKPILNEVFSDNGEHSHWNLIDPTTGENLWSEDAEEDAAIGHPVKQPESARQEKVTVFETPHNNPPQTRS
jgi:hypothetical protein